MHSNTQPTIHISCICVSYCTVDMLPFFLCIRILLLHQMNTKKYRQCRIIVVVVVVVTSILTDNGEKIFCFIFSLIQIHSHFADPSCGECTSIGEWVLLWIGFQKPKWSVLTMVAAYNRMLLMDSFSCCSHYAVFFRPILPLCARCLSRCRHCCSRRFVQEQKKNNNKQTAVFHVIYSLPSPICTKWNHVNRLEEPHKRTIVDYARRWLFISSSSTSPPPPPPPSSVFFSLPRFVCNRFVDELRHEHSIEKEKRLSSMTVISTPFWGNAHGKWGHFDYLLFGSFFSLSLLLSHLHISAVIFLRIRRHFR